METIYSWQERLKKRSFLVLFLTFLYLIVLTSLFIYIFSEDPVGSFLWGLIIGGGIAAFNTWKAYTQPHSVVKGITEAVEARDRRLLSVVEKMKLAYGIKNVEVYEVPWSIINAFVVSKKDMHYLFVTRGAIEKLEDDELENVLAHEFAHMENRDSLYMTFAVVVAGLAVLISYYLLRVLPHVEDRWKNRLTALVIFLAILLAAVSPIVTRILVSSISKEREFLADIRAVQITKYPPGLINALIKVAFENTEAYLEGLNIPKTFGALFFDFEDVETHPPVYERIKKISELTKTPVDERILEKLREMGI